MKIILPCQLISANEFTKVFKYNTDIDLYVSKAFDDVENKHFLIAAIPNIPECNVSHIQFPIPFESEQKRDENFDTFTTKVATHFIEQVISQIKQNKENIKET